MIDLSYHRYLRSRMMIYQIAALTIQSAWRTLLLNRRLLVERSRKSGHEAALIVQACWRSYSCRRIFKYFRDLICVTLKGAPSDLLRSIIPNESSFLDPASGKSYGDWARFDANDYMSSNR